LKVTIDTIIHRAIGPLQVGKADEALACPRALDAWRVTIYVGCNLAELVSFRQANFPSTSSVDSPYHLALMNAAARAVATNDLDDDDVCGFV
jgi:hypothetical protein